MLFGGLITTLVVYAIVRLSTGDVAFSIVPGWHTTIYPPEITWVILTVMILVTSLMVQLIFRWSIKLLTKFWTKYKSP